MGMEREIKLALPPDTSADGDAVVRHAHWRGGPSDQTDEYLFRHARLDAGESKSALRLRRTPDGWLQTFKTAGTADGGLHSRHEWEMPIAGEKLEIDALLSECDKPSAADALRQAAPELVELFRTNFVRTLWRVEVDGSEIEAAIDQGDVFTEVATARRAARRSRKSNSN